MILSGLGVAFPPLAGMAMMMKGKLGRVTEKAKRFAATSDTQDLSKDKDFS